MSEGISRRAFIAGLGAGLGTGLSLAGGTPLAAGTQGLAPLRAPRPAPRPGEKATPRRAPAPATLIDEAKLGQGARVSYVVADARTGQVLEAREPAAALPPASVTKLVTAAYALAALGPGHRFRTRLIATGPIENGVLKGDLVLAGGGDPTLDTDGLATLAQRLAQAGVRRVEGRLRVWGGALPYQRQIDPGQPPQLSYNPAISGLNLNFNRVYFHWQRQEGGYALTMDARAAKHRPEVSIARMRVVAREAPVYTYAQEGERDQWTVARAALGKGGTRWLPVRRPDLYAAEVFATLARAQGVKLGAAEVAKAAPKGRELAAIQSAPLAEILRAMLKYSTNLTAEVVGLAASQARGQAPATLAQSGALMEAWARRELGLARPHFADHSGLSDRTRLTARDLVAALTRLGPESTLAGLLKEVPPLAPDGKRDAGARHGLRGKTGSLNFVSAFAGYETLPGGRVLAFAVLSANLGARGAIAPEDRERPAGARSWGRRARVLQHRLLGRWAALYGPG